MSSLTLLQSLKENIFAQANVKAVYGEPIVAQGKTVVPVAKIVYGYGAGAGTAGLKTPKLRAREEVAEEEEGPFQSALSKSVTSPPVSFRLATEKN